MVFQMIILGHIQKLKRTSSWNFTLQSIFQRFRYFIQHILSSSLSTPFHFLHFVSHTVCKRSCCKISWHGWNLQIRKKIWIITVKRWGDTISQLLLAYCLDDNKTNESGNEQYLHGFWWFWELISDLLIFNTLCWLLYFPRELEFGNYFLMSFNFESI